MNQLHLIQSQFSIEAFNSNFERMVYKGDKLLFLNEGLLNFMHDRLTQTTIYNKEYWLAIDEQLNAMQLKNATSLLTPIGYQEFVQYSYDASKVVSW